MEIAAKMSTKGQLTVPKVVRDALGLEDGDYVIFRVEGDRAVLARTPDFLSLAGPGFRDFTRIAASDPAIWRDILMANREEILKQSARFRHTLDAMEHVIKSGNADALEDLIKVASEARAGWQLGSPRGGGKG